MGGGGVYIDGDLLLLFVWLSMYLRFLIAECILPDVDSRSITLETDVTIGKGLGGSSSWFEFEESPFPASPMGIIETRVTSSFSSPCCVIK